MDVVNDNKKLLIDIQSFGGIKYYRSLDRYEILVFEQYEHYVKGSYTNRYYIAGPNGPLLLTIPLLHSRRGRTAIKDLKISYHEPWQTLHRKTLISAYRRSPWFEFYEDDLSIMYNKKFTFILDWNLSAFELVEKWIGKKWNVKMTDTYKPEYKNAGFVDERHRFLPSEKSDFPTGERLYYPQVFEERNGFIPGLSILDLLFCEGKNARKILFDSS